MWWPVYSNKLTTQADTIDWIYQNDTPGIIPSILNYTILDDTEITRLRVLENTSESLNDDALAQIKYRHHVNVASRS